MNERGDENLLDWTLKQLFDQAFEDGVVTDDEYEIIQRVELDVEEYSKVLDQALNDGVITDTEMKQLAALKEKIMEGAENVAKMDGTIDREERELLKTLSGVVNNYLGRQG